MDYDSGLIEWTHFSPNQGFEGREV
jgi:hypothetical protein